MARTGTGQRAGSPAVSWWAPLVAPDLLVSEVGNILWKKVRFGQLERAVALDIARTVEDDARVVLVSSATRMHTALVQAISFGITMYDALYVALAIHDDTVLVTADARLVNALSATPLARDVRLLSTF